MYCSSRRLLPIRKRRLGLCISKLKTPPGKHALPRKMYLKYSSEFLRKELREANDRWIKASNEEDRLRMEIEKLRKEAEKLESELEEEKRLNRKSSLRIRNTK